MLSLYCKAINWKYRLGRKLREEKGSMDLAQMLADAEKEMYRKKELYYQQPEHERRKR